MYQLIINKEDGAVVGKIGERILEIILIGLFYTFK